VVKNNHRRALFSILFIVTIVVLNVQVMSIKTIEAATSTYKVILLDAPGGTYNTASNRYVAGTYLIPIGTTIYFGAVPISGYVFDHWVVQVSNKGTGTTWDSTLTYTKNPQNLMSNSANRLFQVTPIYLATTTVTYTLTMLAPQGGGVVSPTGTNTYAKGTIVNLMATPSTGWQFDYWTIGGIRSSGGSTSIVTMNSDKTLQAFFKQTTYTLTITSPEGEGTLTPATGTYSYASGTLISLKAVPANGWTFDHWTINGATKTDASISLTITSDTSAKAYFTGSSPIQNTLTMLPPQGQGSVTPSTSVTTYPVNTRISIKATPSIGCEFDYWSLNGVKTSWPASTTITITSDSTIQANFKLMQVSPPNQITPLEDTILEKSSQTLIDGMGSGWTASFGTIAYNSNDYVTGPTSLQGTPRTTGPERLKILKTFATPINLENCNIGFWIKTTGTIPSDLTFYLEVWDSTKLVTNYRQWRYIKQGDSLQGSDANWSHHFVISSNYNSDTPVDMTKITKIVFRFLSSTSSDWTISIDDLKAFPNQNLFPNGAVIITFDGPYPHQLDWAAPIMEPYGYQGVIATAQDAGDSATKKQLGGLYAKGWDIVVYGRMFDNQTTPKPYSETQILNFVSTQQQWLNGLGYTRSSVFLQCNRHLTNVYTDTLLSKYFYFVKGAHWLASPNTKLPTTALTGVSLSPEEDLARLQAAHDDGEVFVFFNHLNNNQTVDYTKEQFATFIDKIHSLGMEVITYSQLLDRYQTYLIAQS
jgi:hypothetical protein